MKLYKGECLEVMKGIPDGSIDAIITDPPYGTTACKWDSVIDFELMWEQLNRIIKPNGAIVLFGSEPFSSALRMSNIKNYKYDWIWSKNRPANISASNYQPMKYHEIISVFYKKQPTYNKQMIPRHPSGVSRVKSGHDNNGTVKAKFIKGLNSRDVSKEYDYKRYSKDFKNPSSLLHYARPNNNLHPTQKPLELMKYLVKTYTNEGETVLDFTMGSGSTGVACVNTNRKFVGIEMDSNYFDIAKQRIKEAEFKLF
tara:strand:+ start:46 stop:810 length:765 start_codon:yes stop_codon:yes gene_type:complete